ncbi:MAG: winged helix DNA-binding protein [Pacificimonas sp.]
MTEQIAAQQPLSLLAADELGDHSLEVLVATAHMAIEAVRKRRMDDNMRGRVSVKQLISLYEKRRKIFSETGIMGDPAWQILLDLYSREKLGLRTTIMSVIVASGATQTTGLRYVKELVRAGYLVRDENIEDKRSAFLSLSASATEKLETIISV